MLRIKETFCDEPQREGGREGGREEGREGGREGGREARSEEHTSELQSRPHISYAVFCLKKKTITTNLISKALLLVL